MKDKKEIRESTDELSLKLQTQREKEHNAD